MFVRRLVRGVRSSWPASETSWACWCRDADERRQHGVEAAGQPRQLVTAAVVDRGGQILGAGHVLGRLRQVFHRAHGGPAYGPAERGSQGHAAQGQQDQHPTQEGERVVDVGQRVEDLDRQRARDNADGSDPVPVAIGPPQGLHGYRVTRA